MLYCATVPSSHTDIDLNVEEEGVGIIFVEFIPSTPPRGKEPILE